MSSKIAPGEYVGEIVEHGFERVYGKAAVVVAVKVDDGQHVETVRCNLFLEGNDAEKTATSVRMTRATLKLCGFDPDAEPLEVLNDDPPILKGNLVPIRAFEKESNGKFYMNFNIQKPRRIDASEARSFTDLLRAAKSEKEEPVAIPQMKKETFSPEVIERAKAEGAVKPGAYDDIPF